MKEVIDGWKGHVRRELSLNRLHCERDEEGRKERETDTILLANDVLSSLNHGTESIHELRKEKRVLAYIGT